MDEIIKRISEGLANQSSRRGFFSTVGKAALGLATILTGQGFFTENAAAQSSNVLHRLVMPNPIPNPYTAGYYWCVHMPIKRSVLMVEAPLSSLRELPTNSRSRLQLRGLLPK